MDTLDPPTPSRISLRPMTQADIPLGLRLKALARWNQTAADWRLLLDAGKGWVASYEDAEVGTATLLPYGRAFSWIGMVLVDPAWRRRGVGTALLRAAIEAAREHGIARLDATPQGSPLYAGLGFRTEYRISRMVRQAAGVRQATGVRRQPAAPLPDVEGCADLHWIRALTQETLAGVVAFDAPIFGAERHVVLQTLAINAPGYALAWVDGAGIRGYCVGRHGSRSEQIGPLVAESLEVACAVLTAALETCGDRPVIVDALDDQEDWVTYLKALGFEVERPFIRMQLSDGKDPLPLGDPTRQYAIIGPEFG